MLIFFVSKYIISYLAPSPFLRPLCIDFRLDNIELADDWRVRGVNEPLLNNEFVKDESILTSLRVL